MSFLFIFSFQLIHHVATNSFAWHCIAHCNPAGSGGAGGGPGGYWLDDEKLGLPMIEQARKLGVRNICVHKGILLSANGVKFAGCRDIGIAARHERPALLPSGHAVMAQ